MLYAQEIIQRQSDPQFGPDWNGRQIRNAFQTAVALAGFHSKDNRCIKLEPKHFSQVFSVSDQFSSYIWLVKQRNSDAQWNAMQMLRRDDWTYAGPPGVNLATNNQQGVQASPRFSNFPQFSFGQQTGPSRSTAPFGDGMGTGGMTLTGGGAANQFGNIQTTSDQQWHTNNIHYPLPVGQSNANLRLQPTPSTDMENDQQRPHCQEQTQSYAQLNPSHQQGLVKLN